MKKHFLVIFKGSEIVSGLRVGLRVKTVRPLRWHGIIKSLRYSQKNVNVTAADEKESLKRP